MGAFACEISGSKVIATRTVLSFTVFMFSDKIVTNVKENQNDTSNFTLVLLPTD
jgi:hypothetical protein